MKTKPFNLIDEPFIPIVTKDGPTTVSLRDALADADSIIGIDMRRPTDAIALYRMLLAVILDALGQPTSVHEWRTMFEIGRFEPERLDPYFIQYHDRFDLHGDHPFYQARGLEPSSGRWRSIALLRPEVASGNNVPLFSSDTEATLQPLTPAEAAVLLISCMGWDTAAIKTGALGDPTVKGNKTTGNPTGPLGQLGVVLPQGSTLFETLVLNVPIGTASEEDLPAWRRDWTPVWSQHQPKGIKELLTWQSRRVRLHEDDGLITAVTVAAGDRLLFTPPALEPHCLWRQVEPAKNSPVSVSQRPVRHQPGRSAWRGMNALLSLEEHEGNRDKFSTSLALRQISRAKWLSDDFPLDVLCVGVVYGNQSAVVEDIVADAIPLPLKALSDKDGEPLRNVLMDLVASAESTRKALNDLDANIRRAEGGEAVPWDKGEHPGDSFMGRLDSPTLRVLHGIQRDPDRYEQGMAAWQRVVWADASRLANDMLNGAAPTSISGHRSGNRKEPLRLSDAEGIFWHALNAALPEHATYPEEER
ncbi:type I-E CRISPR-associated protein Cse1/CasA [Acidipropionibacterium jensenii]|uniref:type I-E CRISPR-associated protein Cse1/CasA n=1 Tax=Acidipropionibacterium jensenii TaxID=1749 RepID=UPI000BC31DAC|nr:type I-E CRISPR-associated protein Cse1/CasA [Acidipropionibacterium jensenii]AZZ41148.1 type I-E CRISPR-associated protein Cse1/CasA [Acidipropionibacterium jensenii]